MPALNKVFLMGNLTADPELKQTSNGISACSFTVAVSRKYKSSDGTTPTDFINVRAWRQQAEFVSKYFKKGKPIFVMGSLNISNYTDQNGQKRTWTEVVAEEIQFVESKGASQNTGFSQPSVDDIPEPPAYANSSNGSSNNGQQTYTPPAYSSNPSGNETNFEELAANDDMPF